MIRILSFLFWLLLSVQLVGTDSIRVIDWKYRVSLNYAKPIYDLLEMDIFEKQSLWGMSRGVTPQKPGDYFADIYAVGHSIDRSTSNCILETYKKYIKYVMPDNLIDSAKLYVDSINSKHRTEFFLRYTDNINVYAISGWWPKFIKYYIAFPKNETLSEKELKTDLSWRLVSPNMSDSLKFTRCEKNDYYLLRAFYKNIMIRNYKISAFFGDGRSEGPDFGQPPPMFSDWYNIIEITIYLDKEFMP